MNLLITGATRGLGLEIVQRQLAIGDHVIATGRSESEALAKLKSEYPGQLQFAAIDLQNVEDLKSSFFDQVVRADWPIHGLVNNAAIAYDDLLTNLDLDQLDQLFRVNVYAPMMLTKLVIRNMLLHKTAGSIVHVSSIAANVGFKGLSMYGASKGALESFSKGVAREWGRMGIRSNCVAPGFMETDMSAKLSDEQRDKIYRRTSLGVATSLDAVTGMVAYLLSDASRTVTGQTLVVDAGSI
jgi:3-oxoacyl-[acyl-carrier protein] reductase